MSKEYDHFWKYHNKTNIDIHAVELIELQEKRNAKQKAALTRIDTWAKAYPLAIFPKPDLQRAAEVLKAAGMTLDSISADNMRHVLDDIKGIVREALKGE